MAPEVLMPEGTEPPNDEMRRTAPGQDGAPPLISGCSANV